MTTEALPVGLACSLALLGAGTPAVAAPFDSQPETIPLLSPAEALATASAPEGFGISLFAAEPEVQQPIAMSFDHRGRLWVAECYSYAEGGAFDNQLRDRIVILEDSDGDGEADRRTLFWDDGERLTSIECGFGGIWVLATPHLLFLPDGDGDDKPDGAPVVIVDGWVPAGHTLVNGLRWGPDGWLYGRHGIQGTSRVGKPGTPDEARVAINCGIWRYHPQREVFEAVCHGTTNPWGMDWNDHGELFFINTVIGHLWHALPGAHYRRMYGEDLRANLYEAIEQTADHVHWDDGREDWTAQAKELSEGTHHAGGGHAHTGLMFYLGDNWPQIYRDDLFTLNLHGRRMNRDHLERTGATYAGRHRPDLVRWGDEWFRGIDLAYGPDGGVYVLDWSDIGECHEADGVHRGSGRIYKISWGGGEAAAPSSGPTEIDVRRKNNRELVRLQLHGNDWFVRQARRVLQERYAGGTDLEEARQQLWGLFEQRPETPRKLRALWCLHVTGGVPRERLIGLLAHQDEHLRAWAVRLLVDDGEIDSETSAALEDRAKTERSGLVLTYLASALQRLPDASRRFALARSLAEHGDFAGDRVLPLMVWYGIEAAVLERPRDALELLQRSKLPRVSRYISRRLTGSIDAEPTGVAALMQILTMSENPALRKQVLSGMADALRGWGGAPAPPGWAEFAKRLPQDETGNELLPLVRELSIVFGEGMEHGEVVRFVLDPRQTAESRRQAIRSLTAAQAEGLSAVLERLLDDPAVAEEAVRGLAEIDLPQFAPLLIERYPRMDGPGKDAAVEVLATLPGTAALLLDAVDRGTVPRTEVDPYVLREMQLADDERLAKRVAETWPEQRLLAEDKLEKIHRYRDELSGEALASADLAAGRKLYDAVCAQCHKLFVNGGNLGPELTGAQRSDLGYWLENIVDPSAVIPEGYEMSLVTLADGRKLTGRIGEEDRRTVRLETPGGPLRLQRDAVESIGRSELSLMPEGLLDGLSAEQRRDLIAYLMAPGQVEEPTAQPVAD
jgi:putative membrane-bound dehydrogenase-like protein